MKTTPTPTQKALELLAAWLRLPERRYKAIVLRFANEMPPDEVLEAVMIAQAKVPAGNEDGFRYFCGVCHSKLKEYRINVQLGFASAAKRDISDNAGDNRADRDDR